MRKKVSSLEKQISSKEDKQSFGKTYADICKEAIASRVSDASCQTSNKVTDVDIENPDGSSGITVNHHINSPIMQLV